jgi:hypothetical protein
MPRRKHAEFSYTQYDDDSEDDGDSHDSGAQVDANVHASLTNPSVSTGAKRRPAAIEESLSSLSVTDSDSQYLQGHLGRLDHLHQPDESYLEESPIYDDEERRLNEDAARQQVEANMILQQLHLASAARLHDRRAAPQAGIEGLYHQSENSRISSMDTSAGNHYEDMNAFLRQVHMQRRPPRLRRAPSDNYPRVCFFT